MELSLEILPCRADKQYSYRLVASKRTKACARPSPILHRRLRPSVNISGVRPTWGFLYTQRQR